MDRAVPVLLTRSLRFEEAELELKYNFMSVPHYKLQLCSSGHPDVLGSLAGMSSFLSGADRNSRVYFLYFYSSSVSLLLTPVFGHSAAGCSL